MTAVDRDGPTLAGRRPDSTDDEPAADLVTDARGHGTPPVQLTELGCTTRHYRLRPGVERDGQAVIVIASPDQPRGAIRARIEHGRIQLTVNGIAGDVPPTDPEEFNPFAESLTAPTPMNRPSRQSRPLAHRFPVGLRRRHEKTTLLPRQLLLSHSTTSQTSHARQPPAARDAIPAHTFARAPGRSRQRPDEAVTSAARDAPQPKEEPHMKDARHLVVVGASLAGLRAVEAARAEGHQDPITLVGEETHLPYDRTVLSKDFLEPGGHSAPPGYCSADSYRELDVELRLGEAATSLDTDARTVRVGTTDISYDRLVIATGVRARRLHLGQDLAGVHTLRTLEDARQLRSHLPGARDVVIIGAGFIGAEAASAARLWGARTTIVEAAPAPLIRSVGPLLGTTVATLHTAHGTRLLCDTGVERVEGRGRVQRVVLSDGTVLDADLVVVGAGTDPAVDWCESSGLNLDNGIVCDASLATSAPGVYAAGDVARWYNPLFERTMRLEHWTSAAEQGALAARNALSDGPGQACSTVPYFWSDWYGQRIQFLGVPDADDIQIFGSPEEHRYVALYRTGERFTGVLAVNRKSEIAKYRQLLRRRATWQEAVDLAVRREGTPAAAGGSR
ncbi:NAD(P)/FAD-dependent oxidoreductase [Streptomyces cyaneofuscatus]|uniref:NAD(P)/FAD-dependent oxidoreductase n=1 Tax=Streptomyces cyaneofuscatus TaxID=66883 RepID=UPI0036C0EE8B